MNFTISKQILLESLTNVSRAISTKNIIPVLNGIVFELDDKGLSLTGSDTELTIQSFIDKKDIVHIKEKGTMIIQSKFILEIIKKMPTDTINFEKIDSLKIKIFSTNNEYTLNCYDPNDYPKIKLEDSKESLMLSSDIFKDIINQTSFAISLQESRPLLTGINIKINGNIMECTATDSYRLAKKTIKINHDLNNEYNIIVPGRNVIELSRIMEEKKDLYVHLFSNKILFKYGNIIFQSNLLNGSYPNTNNLIPTNFDIVLSVKTQELYDAIDRAALLTLTKDKNVVKMKLINENIIISSFASETGKAEEKIFIENKEKKEIEISFSAKYMLDALRTLKEEQILLLLNSDVKPIILKDINNDDLIQLLLPVKTY